ncbi:hypothetical protein PSTG_03927 [Puccinia striiformis f. sp. tritici PST-78]|uniref:BED-type domain-containing protein n=1 Tax=Puccinia striiformis f. sp. tritici PST-78 TaxID=1165861 RepID=A0A0L0VUW5_9BASI|nr:hypothetical protein PSTG_03927 [Puccinia striiformis f. sp. tritici PST-78]
MAAEEPPDHVPSTPPHTSNDPPDVSQSSRCESSCLRTPISHPGFIATQSDSCGALPLRATQPRQRPMIPNRDTFPAEETSNNILEVPDSNTDSSWPRRAAKANQPALAGKITQVSKRTGCQIQSDLAQDSDNENSHKNSQVVPKTDKTKDGDGSDYCVLYFYPPGEGPNQKLASDAYACRWCDKEVKATKQSKYNLKAHQDGADYKSTHKKPCAGRAKAIQSGCSLPPTPAELTAAKAQSTPNNSGTIVAYTTRGRFDNSTLTKILIIWLIRQSLLWLRMEDFHLRLAFDHAIVSSQLPSRVWAAAHAHQLYLEQRSQVIKLIKASESNVSLISDIWTTKGSHKAFVGITICYINKQWKYVSQHLAIKYVSWHHNGKYLTLPFANVLTKHGLHTKITLTTDSGSNNFTMAKGLSAQFQLFDWTSWDVASNHHRCICHVIALILGAGLKELQLSKMMVRSEKTDNPFPTTLLATIVEEDETETTDKIVKVVADGSDDEEIDPVDAEQAMCEPGWGANDEDEYVASDMSGVVSRVTTTE